MACNCNQKQGSGRAITSRVASDVSEPSLSHGFTPVDTSLDADEPESVKGKRWLERWMEMRRGKR